MSNFKLFQQQNTGYLIQAIKNNSTSLSVDDLSMLDDLLDAAPYYGQSDWNELHTSSVISLFNSSLPNDPVAAQQNSSEGVSYTTYQYTGSATGYNNAFFNSAPPTPTASAITAALLAIGGNFTSGYFQSFSLALLSDAIRINGGVNVNTGQLSADLTNFNQAFLAGVSASYLGVYAVGYQPTQSALAAIINAGSGSATANALAGAIQNGEFTVNINASIGLGGDSTSAAVWFLFNLWIALKALNPAFDVDGCINQAITAGLAVPAPVQAGQWWSGGYTSYFPVLSGSTVMADPNVVTAMGVEINILQTDGTTRWGILDQKNITVSNGYGQSLTYWGALNTYNPPSSSCFSADTEVLMANGTTRKICQIIPGDLVFTDKGARIVVLNEAPECHGRKLFRINGLNMALTQGHPLRGVGGRNIVRYAIDPWNMIDGTPSVIASGVGYLQNGVTLSGLDSALKESTITVGDIQIQDKDDDAELVYDLILEDWELGQPCYYVGGPDSYMATESETVNPFYHLPTTAAVAIALQNSLQQLRAYRLTVSQLYSVLSGINFPEMMQAVIDNHSEILDQPELVLEIPKPEFYMDNSKWDPLASALEYQIVKTFSRQMRRFADFYKFKFSPVPRLPGSRALIIHDIEFVGVGEGRISDIEIVIRSEWEKEPLVTIADFKAEGKLHLMIDRCFEVGASVVVSNLSGTVSCNGEMIAGFQARFGRNCSLTKSSEFFLFAPSGNIIGRIAISAGDPASIQLVNFTKKKGYQLVKELGRRLGRTINARTEAYRSRPSLEKELVER